MNTVIKSTISFGGFHNNEATGCVLTAASSFLHPAQFHRGQRLLIGNDFGLTQLMQIW